MNTQWITVPGLLRPDGTLELDRPVTLPAGPVKVTIQASVPAKRDTTEVLQFIWAEQKRLGLPVRTKEQIDADLGALRAEFEEHALALERLQDQAAQSKDPT